MTTSNFIDNIFGGRISADPISAADERTLIDAAREGDAGAYEKLLVLYGPALRAAVTRSARTTPVDSDELRSLALAGFAEALRAVKGDRLAGVIGQHLQSALFEAVTQSAPFTIPTRTAKRYFAAYGAAAGDLAQAVIIAATDHGMDAGTFRDVHAALGNWRPLDETDDERPHQPSLTAAPIEASLLCSVALGVLDPIERDIVRMGYGFTDYEPLSDAEIAERISYSRSRVQRIRTGAIAKMRDALALYDWDTRAHAD